MNTYLELTKAKGRNINSQLYRAVKDRKEKRQELFENITKQQQSRSPDWYNDRFHEYYNDIPTNVIGASLKLKPSSAMLLGNGTKSVLETHVTLHRIYGVPYIPGTAIKGITAHYCHQMMKQADNQQLEEMKEIVPIMFGTPKQKGFIQFHDAWCTPESVASSLVLDVMTPHHKKYNQINVEIETPSPRDDDSPEPISFLSVQGEFKLLLTIEGNDEASQAWLQLATGIVKQAIEANGVGGKVNVGYGRFTVEDLV